MRITDWSSDVCSSDLSVNLATERADVTFTGASDPHSVVQAIERAGYAVPEADVEIGVAGMTCASCVGHVEMALSKVPGVITATVNLATEKASIRYRSSIASLDDLEAAISGAGYEPRQIGRAWWRERGCQNV